MYIQFPFTLPHGGVANFHSVKSFVSNEEDLLVDVYHYASENAEHLMYRDYYKVPLSILSPDPFRSITEWLISSNGYFSGGQIITGLTELEKEKSAKIAYINSVRDEYLKVAYTDYGAFDADVISKTNLLGCIQKAKIKADKGENSTTYYRLADNTTVAFTLEELESASVQVAEYIELIYAKSWILKDQINACETVEEVKEIYWQPEEEQGEDLPPEPTPPEEIPPPPFDTEQ